MVQGFTGVQADGKDLNMGITCNLFNNRSYKCIRRKGRVLFPYVVLSSNQAHCLVFAVHLSE